MSRPVRGAFRAAACVAVLSVGCGGRTSGTNPSVTSGTNAVGGSWAVAGSMLGGAGATSGATAGSTGLADSGGTNGSGIGTSGCDINLCSCQYHLDCDCSEGLTACGLLDTTVCTDVRSDSLNCGACAHQCGFGQNCQAGTCVPLLDASGDRTEAGTEAGAPPSCAPGGPGMTNCGPGGSGTESCCTSLEVTGGTYYRTYTNDGSRLTGEADPATVTSFRLDKYLVTVGRFRQFVNVVLPADGGAGWLPSPGSGKHPHLNNGNGLAATGGGYEPGWVATDDSQIMPTDANLANPNASPAATNPTWTSSVGSQENLAINHVNWWEAYAFCIWDGGFLPSEAEWEYAAAGGDQQREYPWGSIEPGSMSQYAIYDLYFRTGGVTAMAPVGAASLGAGLWGQLDLVGNLSEWNLDWFAMYGDPCVDCAIVTQPMTLYPQRPVRGGNYLAFGAMIWSSYRSPNDAVVPSSRLDYVGFRCARTL